jgi:hypothetical protein
MDDERRIDLVFRDDGIIVVIFKAMDRQAADEFARIVRRTAESKPERMLTLYDMRPSDAPTSYFTKLQTQLYENFDYPDNSKTAFLISSTTNEIWVRIFRRQYRSNEEYNTFYDMDEAIAWLLE